MHWMHKLLGSFGCSFVQPLHTLKELPRHREFFVLARTASSNPRELPRTPTQEAWSRSGNFQMISYSVETES